MTTTSTMSAGRLWSAYLGEMRFEFVKSLRTPAFAVPTLFFPVMFYLLFGVFLGSMRGNAEMAQYTFATYGVFGAMGPGLFGFGVSLAIEREQGLLTLKQALPEPPGSYLLARAAMAMLFVGIISLMLTAIALFAGKVPITFSQGVQLFCINVLGALPFCAIGMFVGSWVSGAASPAIVNFIFLPMAFLSGLWVPLQFLPQFLQTLAPVWPSYHLAQMALASVGAPSQGTFLGHTAVLTAVSVVFFLLAMHRMHGGGLRLFGARPRLAVALVVGAAGLVLALSFAGVLGKKSATTGAPPAPGAAAADTPASVLPAGVPAPDIAVIADFDNGSAAASYGLGFFAGGDESRGGSSTATQRIVADGAGGSRGALEVSGEIGDAIQYPFAGSTFFPEGPPMEGRMDMSAKKTLSFFARGDGRRYTLLVMSDLPGGIPLMQDFVAGPEWTAVSINLAEYSTADWKTVKLIGMGSMGPVGPFRFQIDEVRLE